MVLNDITNDSAVTRGRLGTSTLSNTDTNFAKKERNTDTQGTS
jgi:hypothetical protein